MIDLSGQVGRTKLDGALSSIRANQCRSSETFGPAAFAVKVCPQTTRDLPCLNLNTVVEFGGVGISKSVVVGD
mgnify:CR=1